MADTPTIFALVPAADDDEATVERVAEAIYCGDTCYSDAWASQSPAIHDYYRPIARAALAAIPAPPPCPTCAKVRAIVGECEAGCLQATENPSGKATPVSYICADAYDAIADLFPEADQ